MSKTWPVPHEALKDPWIGFKHNDIKGRMRGVMNKGDWMKKDKHRDLIQMYLAQTFPRQQED